MIVSVVSNTALIGITRITSNYILIKSFIFYSAFTLALLISVGGRLESPSAVVCLCPGTCLILKSNNRIQVSYLVINISNRSGTDLLSWVIRT